MPVVSKTDNTVKPTLGIIYTCSQQRKDSKTKSEEGVVWMSGWLGEGFQLFILWILGAKVWQQNWQYCQLVEYL